MNATDTERIFHQIIVKHKLLPHLLRRSREWRSAELGSADVWLLGERQMLARALSEEGDDTAEVLGVCRLD